MRVLILGGTRFVGVYLTKALIAAGHDVTLLSRGNRPLPVDGVKHIIGDRRDAPESLLEGQIFDAVFDNNGRELDDTQPWVEHFRDRDLQHYVYMSSAGVYLKSNYLPHCEGDLLDPRSRHRGKAETENFLKAQYEASGFPFTSIRPVYIYGSGNYNDIEAFFFDRISRGRTVLVPDQGQWVTQLGHVQDLAASMMAVLGNPKAQGQIYNISDRRLITFTGLVEHCAAILGKAPKVAYYNPKWFDSGKRKSFPLRIQHFFVSIEKARTELGWQPQVTLEAGLRDFWLTDYQQTPREPDFSLDDQILATL